MQYRNVLSQRRSIRKYKDKDVSLETIKEIIRTSTYAPSAGNEQSWKFVIVNNIDVMKEMSDSAKQNMLSRIESGMYDYLKKYEKMMRNEEYNIFYNAPALVFIVSKKGQNNAVENCTLAASYFMMEATSRGLGTCWINFAKFIANREQIGIPSDYQIIAPIIIGYPYSIPTMPSRREPEILNIID